jgi:YD repeat-containing protein
MSIMSIRNRIGLYLGGALFAALLGVSGPALAANGSVTYTYDALGRVATASYDTGVIIIYSYDPNGNRTQQVVNVNTGLLTWSSSMPCAPNCWGAALWN